MDASLRAWMGVWEAHNTLLLNALRGLDRGAMALRAHPSQWATWQLASHIAGGRMYWMHDVLGEGDAALRDIFRVTRTTVPGLDLRHAAWEDVEDEPRSTADILDALERTWDVIAEAADRWTAEELAGATPALHSGRTRGWVLAHLFEHDAHHGGEVSLILSANGLPGLNL